MKNRIISFFMILTLIFSLSLYVPSMATDYDLSSFGTTYTSVLTVQNTFDRYKVILTKPGRITINMERANNGGLVVCVI